MKYAFIQRHRRVWPISVQCRVLGVSVSGYHEHFVRRASDAQRRHLSDDALLVHIKAIHAETRGGYGWPRIWKELLARGIRVGKQRVHPSKRAGLIFHSDRGSQYASHDFREVLKEYGITSSMSRRGNCWDNACSETLFGSLKVERLHGQRFETRRQAKDETIAWLLWYNSTRLHSTLAYVSPMRFEENWLAAQPKQASS